LLRHKQHSHNDATTTQPRRTKRQDKSLKDPAGLYHHHHHHHRRWKRRYNSSTLIHSSITYVPFIQQHPPISLVSKSTGRVGAR
jgi:hypothetical protein